MPSEYPNSSSFSSDPLLNRFFLTAEEKKSKEKGKAIIRAFYDAQTTNQSSLNFFRLRSVRWQMLLLWAKGSQSIQEFLDYMDVSDANKAWINLDTTQTRIAPQFVSTLVESMSKTKTYPCVKAIDDGSINEKEDRLLEAIYLMHEKDTVNAMQSELGVQLEPPTVFIPDDEISAKIYFELQDRLPKEIRFEKMLQSLMNEIKYESVLNRKTIHDLVVTNFGATKIERCGVKQYTVRKCIPTNMVYNFFMNDTGEQEITQVGEFYNLKVKDFRYKFGKSESNPEGLTEEEIFNLAKLSSTKNIGTFNYMWRPEWANNTNNYNYNRPYDDCSILVLDAEVDMGEDAWYVAKKDKYGKEDIQAKRTVPYQQVKADGTIIPQQKPEDAEVIRKPKNTWMRGVYAPYGDVMLYWGRPDLIISPYTNSHKTLSSYTVNIPNNDGDYVPSLFERIMEPLREYQLVKLKRKQIISLLEPDGYRVDVESARNLDLGNGNTIEWREVVRIKRQTGAELWSSKGLNPAEQQAPPITEGSQNNNISKVIELTNVLAGIVQEIRQLIGVPLYRDGSDVGDRTAAKLAEAQSQSSFNVTDFVLVGNNELWQETFYKICLLHWNDIVKEEPETKDDILNTRFDVSVKFKSTEYQRQLLEQDIAHYSQVTFANGDPAITPADAMMLREIDDPKLANWYLVNVMKQNKKQAMEESAALQQQNAAVQAQAAEQAAQQQMQIEQAKAQAEAEKIKMNAHEENKSALIKGLFDLAGKGMQVPPYMIPLIQELIPNIAMPLAAENQQMSQALAQGPPQQQEEQQEMPPDQSQQSQAA